MSHPLIRVIRHASLSAALLPLAACSPQLYATPMPWQPTASLQELMQNTVDPSADGVWNAVATVTSQSGETLRQPHTPAQWLSVRRAALTLAESANLLVIEGRRVGARDFPAEAAGALSSTQIQQRIAARRPTFNGFAVALRVTAVAALGAIDAQDPQQLVIAGSAIDQVCEDCHLKFWYPNQVIPSLPDLPPPATDTSP